MRRTKYNQALKSLDEEQAVRKINKLIRLLLILFSALILVTTIVGICKLGSVAQCYTGERNCYEQN